MKKLIVAALSFMLGLPLAFGKGVTKLNVASWKGCYDNLAPDAVFLDIEGDQLTWGQVSEQVRIRMNVMPHPTSTEEEEFNQEMNYRYQRAVTDLLQKYILNCITAYQAKREGISLTTEEFRRQIDILKKNLSKAKSPWSKRQLELLNDEHSLLWRDVRNNMLTKKYAEEKLLPQLKADVRQVKKILDDRHLYNQGVFASNCVYKADMERILSEIKANKISFSEAAREYSECGTSADDGYYGEVELGEMCPEIETAFMKLQPNELSDVVETPYSYHIVKLIKKNHLAGDQDNGMSISNGVVSCEIAHIMIEKIFLKPELSVADADEIVRRKMLRKALQLKQNELIGKVKIVSKIPLFDTSEYKRPIEIMK